MLQRIVNVLAELQVERDALGEEAVPHILSLMASPCPGLQTGAENCTATKVQNIPTGVHDRESTLEGGALST